MAGSVRVSGCGECGECGACEKTAGRVLGEGGSELEPLPLLLRTASASRLTLST